MKKLAILILVFTVLLLVQVTKGESPAPPGGTPTTHMATFNIGSGTATVNSGVYQCNDGEYNGKYVYTYQISNINTGVGLSFFSVGVTIGATVIGHDCAPGNIGPEDWSAVGDNLPLVQSVNASFDTPIKNGQGSALLWFVSDYGPTMGEGFLFGFLSRVPEYDSAEVLAPVPEPATISLLTFGGILAARARGRNSV
jgi:hypothetical protein